jgi:peptide/nickel transport system substrate-binding protein
MTTLDPTQVRGDPTWLIAPNLYDTLIFPDVEKVYIPWIAKSWKVSGDGLKYTFYLKKDIPFHDGAEVTAEDVAFSMDRLLTLKESTLASRFNFIKPGATKALDRYTVEFNLSRRSPQFMVSLFIFKILNKKVIMNNKVEGKYGEFGDYGLKYLQSADAGSGPYIAVEHKSGTYLKMRRFEEYPFRKWQPNSIDTVMYYTIPEAITTATKLKAGELDMGNWTLPAQITSELKKNQNFIVSEDSTDAIFIVAMNNKRPPLNDPFVRKAAAHAFDYATVTTKIFAGGKRGRGPLPDRMAAGCDDIVTYDFDLEKAKALLKKSKYSAEELKKFTLEIAPVAGYEAYSKFALMFSSNLKKIGLNTKIIPSTWAQLCLHAQKPETSFHFAAQFQSAKVPHPLQNFVFFTQALWGTAYPLGGMYYSNPAVTEAIERANNTNDMEEQSKYYCTAQRLIAEDSPAIFSHTVFRYFPMWRYVKGYTFPVGAAFFQCRIDRLTMDTEDPLFRKNHGW